MTACSNISPFETINTVPREMLDNQLEAVTAFLYVTSEDVTDRSCLTINNFIA